MGRKKTSKKIKPEGVDPAKVDLLSTTLNTSNKAAKQIDAPKEAKSPVSPLSSKKSSKKSSQEKTPPKKRSQTDLVLLNHELNTQDQINNDDIDEQGLDLASPLDENLSKLLTEEERIKMEENLDIVECYLGDIGIVDMKVDREKLIIAIPFDYEEFTFLSHIVLSPEWILIKTSIFEIDQLTQSSLINLFAEILKGNFILNSVVYSLDPENKSIWAQADVPISADFDTFKLNYFSIVFAIDYFMKNISPKLQMQLRSTTERENFKNTNSDLYI